MSDEIIFTKERRIPLAHAAGLLEFWKDEKEREVAKLIEYYDGIISQEKDRLAEDVYDAIGGEDYTEKSLRDVADIIGTHAMGVHNLYCRHLRNLRSKNAD